MTTEEDATGMGKYLATAMKVAVVVVLLPLLPLAVAFNVLGIADRLSPLPWITKGGGAVAGIVTLIYVGGILGVATAGGIVATGGEVPFVGDDGPETPEPEPTTTPTEPSTATPMATPTATPTATPSADERRHIQLGGFKEEYLSRVAGTLENESYTGVPVIGSEYQETDSGHLELWIVFWECDFAMAADDQWITLANDIVNTAGPHEGAQPDRVRIYAVSNLTNFHDEITYVEMSEAEATYNETLDGTSYTRSWWERRQEPTQTANETAYQIIVEDSGQEVADTAFYVDHADDNKFKCNGGAKPAEGSEHRQEHEENTNAIGLESLPGLHGATPGVRAR